MPFFATSPGQFVVGLRDVGGEVGVEEVERLLVVLQDQAAVHDLPELGADRREPVDRRGVAAVAAVLRRVFRGVRVEAPLVLGGSELVDRARVRAREVGLPHHGFGIGEVRDRVVALDGDAVGVAEHELLVALRLRGSRRGSWRGLARHLGFDRLRAQAGELVVLLRARGAGHADRADHLAVVRDGHAALQRSEVVERRHREAALVHDVLEVAGRLAEHGGGARLARRDARRGAERPVHSRERDQVAAVVDDRDRGADAQAPGLLLDRSRHLLGAGEVERVLARELGVGGRRRQHGECERGNEASLKRHGWFLLGHGGPFKRAVVTQM